MQKALAVEAERGYCDIVGKQYRFSEFLCLSLGKPPKTLSNSDRVRWQDLAQSYIGYPQLSVDQRHALVTNTRNFLQQK